VRFSSWIGFFHRHLSMPGLVVGALLFSMSLTPSLLPRTFLVQGLLSGCTFAAGYAIGVFLEWVWDYMEIKWPEGPHNRWLRWAVAGACVLVAAISLYQLPAWQNSVREAMGAEPVEGGHQLYVLLVALVPAALFILLGTLLVHGVRFVTRRLVRFVPRRVAFVLSLAIVGFVTVSLVNGLLLRNALRAADAFFERLDGLAGQYGEPPADPLHSGSTASLVPWTTIGRDGRIYVESGPSREEIEAAIGRPAMEPLRVYVGLRSAPTFAERADLALAEMLRVGAFDRSVLVVIMPVGTGWVDPAGIDSLEYLQAGDVASVALQYSYLTSPLSLVVEPDYGIEAAQVLFNTVYRYWTALPRDSRPRLYLHGLSLGAHGSQASTEVFDVLGDPFNGALWAGPPFTSPIWRWATANRQAGSPEWLPRFGNDTSIRFANRGSQLGEPDAEWGPMRLAFLQYPSDPIVFFDWSILYRAPDWMTGERGAGVSPALNWYPVVTFLQLGMDMALGLTSPVGYGHVYSAADYTDAWRALVEPPGWDDAGIERLKDVLSQMESATTLGPEVRVEAR
jgi:uncharacterized membrane protein